MSSPLRSLAFLPIMAVPFVAQLVHAGVAWAATEVYASGEESGEIIVVDVDKGAVAARIPVGKRPRGIKLSRDGKLLYVALSGSPRGGPGVEAAAPVAGARSRAVRARPALATLARSAGAAAVRSRRAAG